jgi:hypothetical protein
MAFGVVFGLVARVTAPIDGDTARLKDGAHPGSCTSGLGMVMLAVTSALRDGLVSKGPR